MDTLVNNAGLMLLGPVVGADPDDWNRMIGVNIQGMLSVTHAALPHWLLAAEDSPRRVADIVNISSIAGRVAWNGYGVYSLTKFGANGFTEALRKEVTRRHVRVGVVEPGGVATELASQNNDDVRTAMTDPFYEQTEVLAPEDIADGVAYMVTRPRHASVDELWIMPTTRSDLPHVHPLRLHLLGTDRPATRMKEKAMQYTRLGSSGLKISRIAMGAMSFGEGDSGREGWPIPYEDAVPLFRQALDLGITFWDTANGYNAGTSEEAVGRALKELTRRDDIVVATKVYFPVHDGPGGSGLSRKAIMEQIDASLTRLGTDYIDLYQIHHFDPVTPVEETMEALHDVVKAGKAPLPRRLKYGRVAVRQVTARRPTKRLDPVHLHAGPVQPDQPR